MLLFMAQGVGRIVVSRCSIGKYLVQVRLHLAATGLATATDEGDSA